MIPPGMRVLFQDGSPARRGTQKATYFMANTARRAVTGNALPQAVGGRGDYLSGVSPHLFLRPDRYQLVVLYLLTTKDALWQRIAPAIRAGQIDYSAVRQGDAKMIQTILRNAQYPEHGVPTGPFPIPDEEYARCIEFLNTLEIGDPIKRDCITGAST